MARHGTALHHICTRRCVELRASSFFTKAGWIWAAEEEQQHARVSDGSAQVVLVAYGAR